MLRTSVSGYFTYYYFTLVSGSKKSSDSVRRHPGVESVTSADPPSDRDDGRHSCLWLAVVVAPVIGVCVLAPIIVVALRLLAGSPRTPGRRQLAVLSPTPPSAADQKPSPAADACPFCGDRSDCPGGGAAGSSGPRNKFVVLTVAAQARRSPGGGYQQILQPPQSSLYACRCCEPSSHVSADRTAPQLDTGANTGDFV